jgi:hypothetical protein
LAVYNEILVGRFNRGLQKLFGMKGGPPAPQLASEIAVTHSLMSGVEHRYLEGWQKFGVNVNQAAGGAGTRAGFRIDNPKGSKIIAVIERITLVGQAADQPFLTYSIISAGDFAQTVIAVNTGLDQRGPQSPNLHVTAQSTAAAIVGVGIYGMNLAVAGMQDLILFEDHELPLYPNSSYTVYSNNLNVALSGNLWWRERVQEDSEVT